MLVDLQLVKGRIPFLQNAIEMEEIKKGYSFDKKYVVHNQDGQKYLLRTATLDKLERKQAEFELLKEMKRLDVQTSKPIDIGKWEDMQLCYYILSFIEGKDAREALSGLTIKEQYTIGYTAGKDMAKINTYPAPASVEPWVERIVKKHKRYLAAYATCGVEIRHVDKIQAFIDENIHYLNNRPNMLQHDDFHVGNLIVNERQYAGTVDFDRYDWGDPYFDFVKVGLFSSEVSVPFCKGQLSGYFGEEIPEDFWRIYSIYMAMTIFSAVVWTVKESPHQIDEMMKRVNRILDEHGYFDNGTPVWFYN
ncbi:MULTISPECIES: phosphotransferase [unclassified Bacillus (in: firmicutes)]|uniref:phosphotransferase n=1 Tax=unclassified Bacillus (in: firmicutes) TaxID=185979 RepID=UPI0008F13108|nr:MULTISPECIES: phosphotransferase [unclassified Bacillus (in: firmicutes)]SFA71512.1 Predicted kinase, aminoglycoside phosphotransferase (APT) family [Bacillus sp. UNCCL13]SFQ61721.1 Predicted kinase, aminoglycoside phosphotransferase (APT) family [Bacillus sp. cl95]